MYVSIEHYRKSVEIFVPFNFAILILIANEMLKTCQLNFAEFANSVLPKLGTFLITLSNLLIFLITLPESVTFAEFRHFPDW